MYPYGLDYLFVVEGERDSNYLERPISQVTRLFDGVALLIVSKP